MSAPTTVPVVGELHRGQTRLAVRLTQSHGDRLRYVHELGWHVWDGTRWARDRRGEARRLLIEEVLRPARHEAVDLDKSDRNALLADVDRCESSAGQEGVLKIAGSLAPFTTTVDDLDADPWLLNTTSGTLDLRTGNLRPHTPRDLLTKVTGCGYDQSAAGPAFAQFIGEVLPDDDLRDFVQTLLGVALVGKVVEHVLPIFTGVGKNGKSTLLNVVRLALGDYAIEAEPDLLIERDRAHPTGLMDPRGTRLAVCQESDDGRRPAVSTVKRLTGGDTIPARRMRADFVEFRPSHTAVLVTNHKPRVPGDDPALWRRLRVVPFDFVPDAPDPHLPDRLDAELTAVLAWLIAGNARYASDGLVSPQAVEAATDTYRAASDMIGRFLEESTVFGSDLLYARAGDLFGEWQAWCHRNNERPGRGNEFSQALEQRGYRKTRRAVGQVYLGLGIAAQDQAA